MNHWRNSLLIKYITCLVLSLLVINPALALQYQQFDSTRELLNKIPDFQPKAYHIHVSQKQDIIALLHKKGYEVIPATAQQAEDFIFASTQEHHNDIQLAANFNLKKVYEKDCPPRRRICHTDDCEQYSVESPADCYRDEPPSQQSKPKTSTSVSVHTSGSANFKLPNLGGGGGGGRDAAAVMLIVIGVVVIAALFIYAGKWLIDAMSNDEDYYAYWWDIGMHVISLDTPAAEHGRFSGIKLSGGFVPNMHTNFGLALEVGKMDLDLTYNRDTKPIKLNLEGGYWLIGPSVRWLLGYNDSEQIINHSYIYLELLGGSSDQEEVDKMAIARIGFNTGLGAHIRMGIHYGAFYLGLDKDQGFANDGDNYWNMIGVELGYQF